MNDGDEDSSELSVGDGNLKASIEGGLRSLVTLVPFVGSAVSQAWSEFKTHSQNARVDEFFREFSQHAAAQAESLKELEARVRKMPDSAELLERTVSMAVAEVSLEKRKIIAGLYSNLITDSAPISTDERLDILTHVETLSCRDLQLLNSFYKAGGPVRGDQLTQTGPYHDSFSSQQRGIHWTEQHASLLHSLAKLQGRGLLIDGETVNAAIAFVGSESSPFNQFRKKAWRISVMGKKLCNSLRNCEL